MQSTLELVFPKGLAAHTAGAHIAAAGSDNLLKVDEAADPEQQIHCVADAVAHTAVGVCCVRVIASPDSSTQVHTSTSPACCRQSQKSTKSTEPHIHHRIARRQEKCYSTQLLSPPTVLRLTQPAPSMLLSVVPISSKSSDGAPVGSSTAADPLSPSTIQCIAAHTARRPACCLLLLVTLSSKSTNGAPVGNRTSTIIARRQQTWSSTQLVSTQALRFTQLTPSMLLPIPKSTEPHAGPHAGQGTVGEKQAEQSCATDAIVSVCSGNGRCQIGRGAGFAAERHVHHRIARRPIWMDLLSRPWSCGSHSRHPAPCCRR
jgi:hypothetical protein